MYNFSYVHYNCDDFEFYKCARRADGRLECVCCGSDTVRGGNIEILFLYGKWIYTGIFLNFTYIHTFQFTIYVNFATQTHTIDSIGKMSCPSVEKSKTKDTICLIQWTTTTRTNFWSILSGKCTKQYQWFHTALCIYNITFFLLLLYYFYYYY